MKGGRQLTIHRQRAIPRRWLCNKLVPKRATQKEIPTMGDKNQNQKCKRPILTLAGERCEWTGESLAAIRLRERFEREDAERRAASEQARQRAEERKRVWQAKQEIRENRARTAAKRAAADQAYAEKRRQKWLQLVSEAADIGLKPDPEWSEREFVLALRARRQQLHDAELRQRKAQALARGQLLEAKNEPDKGLRRQREEIVCIKTERLEARNREFRRPLDSEEIGELYEAYPAIVKHGDPKNCHRRRRGLYADQIGNWRRYNRIHIKRNMGKKPKSRRPWQAD